MECSHKAKEEVKTEEKLTGLTEKAVVNQICYQVYGGLSLTQGISRVGVSGGSPHAGGSLALSPEPDSRSPNGTAKGGPDREEKLSPQTAVGKHGSSGSTSVREEEHHLRKGARCDIRNSRRVLL